MRNEVMQSDLDDLLLKAIAKASEIEIVFSNGWRYGPTILEGEINTNDIFNMLPVDPYIKTDLLSGKELKEMLEDNMEKTFSSNPMQQMGGYLKRARGLKVYFKIENPLNHRIQSIFNQDGPIEDKTLYQVAYITEQGVPSHIGQNHQTLKIKAIDALKDYLKDNVYKGEETVYFAI